MKNLLVTELIHLPRYTKGATIIQATKETIENNRGAASKPIFFKHLRDTFDSRYSIGQTSQLPYEHLMVLPSTDPRDPYPDYFDVREEYTRFMVMSHFLEQLSLWPRRKAEATTFGEEEAAEAVRVFAQQLRAHRLLR